MIIIEVKNGMVVSVKNHPNGYPESYIIVDHDDEVVTKGHAELLTKEFRSPRGYAKKAV